MDALADTLAEVEADTLMEKLLGGKAEALIEALSDTNRGGAQYTKKQTGRSKGQDTNRCSC